ncbi:MAG: glycosyltransferase family 39 protein [Archangium sp.]|nr:glycosyltransferase family 39 protein [Archangium sp.]MDP3158342.1 glycosyltransferase family 39 protein [Archangium sp.]MDP3569567.1 glycosyltransferase family 39 protein [Archangium sp.]
MKRWLPPVLLTLAFVLFRVPALMNPGFINSDGAIAGLQASRMLEGEWEVLHWARDYLTSIDSVMALPFFALFGATPLVLMCVTVLAQLVSMWLAYAIVARRLGPWLGFVLTLPLVFMTMGLNIYLFFNMRQWCMAIVLLSFFLIDRAAESRRPTLLLVLGILAAFVAMFVDLFAAQFLPGLLLFACLSALDGTWKFKPWPPLLPRVILGTALGVVVLTVLRWVAHVSTGRAHLNTRLIPKNWPLLVEQCLPSVIGSKVFAMQNATVALAASPGWFAPVQFLGATVFVAGLVSGAALFFAKRIPWRIRVLGAVGSGVAFTSIFGFLCSSTAVDIVGSRLLLPVVLTLPFTLAPLAFLAATAPRLGLVLSPYLLTTVIGGWLSYGVMVDGPVPQRTEQGAMSEERALISLLRDRQVKYAAANYWLSYRLTFIAGENPIVVSENSEDRYPRWRLEFDQASRVAYLIHPDRPELTLEDVEAGLVARKLKYEKLTVLRYTVFLVEQHH